MQHFIVDRDISGSLLKIENQDLLHQMKDVLRFRVGDECVVLDGKGSKAKGEIEELHRKGASISLKDHSKCDPKPRSLRLYFAIPKKPATLEMIVQKATELGVTDLIPFTAARTQLDHVRKPERLLSIIREACEQSERCFLPTLHDVSSLQKLIENPPKGLLLVGEPWKHKVKLKDIDIPEESDVNVIIGPEGGLSDIELEALEEAGAKLFLLGETVLRMETAVIAALSIVQFG